MKIKTTLQQIFAIANVTYYEILRQKILWSSFLFGIVCVFLAYAASDLSYTDNSRIALTFGFTSISLIGGLIAVVLGASLIAKEVQERTLYLVLTKSISRYQFVVGKFLGLWAISLTNTLLMMALMLGVYLLTGGKSFENLGKGLSLLIVELGVLTAATCVFSAFSTTTLSAILGISVWVIGHAMPDFKVVIEKLAPSALKTVLTVVSTAFPDLSRFDIKAEIAHQLSVSSAYWAVCIGYGLFYIAFCLTLSCMIFSRRDL